MTIYGEYLFAENFITGIIILHVVGGCCKVKLSKLRISLGGMLCGLYGFIILIPIPSFATVLSEVAFAPLVAAVAIGHEGDIFIAKAKSLAKRSLLLFAVTYLWGGISIALLYALGCDNLIAGTVVYMNLATYIKLTSILLSAYILLTLIISFVKARRLEESASGTATLCASNNKLDLYAVIDSGNFLKDPITGTGVSLLSKSAMEKLEQIVNLDAPKMVLLPYSTIDRGSGILTGYRIDYIEFNGRHYAPAIISEAPGELGNIDVLLSSQLLEKGY